MKEWDWWELSRRMLQLGAVLAGGGHVEQKTTTQRQGRISLPLGDRARESQNGQDR